MSQIVVPALGESVSEATIAKWLKKEGDSVKADEPLVELETDKVTLEVNAPASGTLAKIAVQSGATVNVGAILGEISEGGVSDTKPAPAPTKQPEQQTASASAISDPAEGDAPQPAAPQSGAAPSTTKEASPSPDGTGPAARKAMADNGIDPVAVSATGPGGRITKEDVVNHQSAPQPAPPPQQAPASKPQPARDAGPREEKVKMTKLRQVIARRLKDAQNTAAILTTFNEVDMGAVMELRNQYKDVFEKKHGVKLGFMSFFVKAAVNALKEIPAVNAEISGDEIIYKNYYDISVAVSSPQGLVVPVVRDCDQKSMAAVEKEIGSLGAKARDGKLTMSEMSGGTFTITNGGTFGSLMSTPIINPPQVGILGMHKIQQRAMVMKNGSIEARPMMYIALSYDHRIIDGREAVTFLVRIKDAIEDPQRLVLDI